MNYCRGSILAGLSPIIFSCSAVFVYKSETAAKHGVLFVVYPVLYVGVESLVFGNNDDASAIFLPARQSRVETFTPIILRHHFCTYYMLLLILRNLVLSPSFLRYVITKLYICFLKNACVLFANFAFLSSIFFFINFALLRSAV